MASIADIRKHLLEENNIKINYNFHDKCLAKNLYQNIKYLVNTAKVTYKEDLDIRRNRLRQLIEGEEHDYEIEYRGEVESRLENTIRQRQEMLVKIRNEKLKEEADFNKSKKAEQIMNNSDHYRTMITKENLREVKKVQLLQIEEAKQKRLDDKKLECMWLDVQNRINDKYDQQQQYESCLAKSICLKTNDYNVNKIELNKRPIDMTSDYYEGFGSLRKDDIKIDQEKKMKRKQMDIQNLMYNRKFNDVRKQKECREIEIEQLYNEQCKREHLAALSKSNEKKLGNRKEIETYLQYVRTLKTDLQKEQYEENQLLMMEQMKAQCKDYEKYQNWKKQRDINAKKNHQILIQQIEEHDRKKFDETILINEQNLVDKEIRRRENCAEELKELNKKKKKLILADELKQQAEYDILKTGWYRQKDINEHRRAQEYQDKVDELAKKFSQEVQPRKIHPNMKLLECPCQKP